MKIIFKDIDDLKKNIDLFSSLKLNSIELVFNVEDNVACVAVNQDKTVKRERKKFPASYRNLDPDNEKLIVTYRLPSQLQRKYRVNVNDTFDSYESFCDYTGLALSGAYYWVYSGYMNVIKKEDNK